MYLSFLSSLHTYASSQSLTSAQVFLFVATLNCIHRGVSDRLPQSLSQCFWWSSHGVSGWWDGMELCRLHDKAA